MIFTKTKDDILFLYRYYSLNVKEDEISRKVYGTFKKEWDTYYGEIKNDFRKAMESLIDVNGWWNSKIAIAVMPSHIENAYGNNLLRLCGDICTGFNFINASKMIVRTSTKMKSTTGGERSVLAHLNTLDIDFNMRYQADYYIVLDDITTTGSSLNAAKCLLANNGIAEDKIIKIAIAKTSYDE